MSKATHRAGAVLSLLVAFFVYNAQAVQGQIAPTTSASISGSVNDSTGKPVANAKISLSGPKSASTQTDTQGLFVFVGVPFGMYQISAASAGLGTATRNVLVQGDVNVAIQYEPAAANGLKTIASVSTSAHARFNVTPASITQVNPIANAFEGETSWRTILEQIPGVAQAGLLNGINTYASVPDSPFVPVKVSINGALPYETATLLDDMPLIGRSDTAGGEAGAGTDLGTLPLNAFGAADVVRGPGANSPSIVDSIGGSFVLHAPSIVNQNHYDFSISTDPYGGIVANGQVAVRWNKISAIVTYGVNDSPGPLTNAGISAQEVGPLTVDGKAFVAYSAPCSLPTCESGELLNPNYALASFPYYGVQQGLLICCTNFNTAWSQHSGSLALTYTVSPAVNAEVFYAGQNSQQAIESVPYFTTDFTPPVGYSGAIPPGLQIFPYDSYYPIPLTVTSSLLEEKITAELGRGVLRVSALQNRYFTYFGYTTPASIDGVQLFGGGTLNGASTVFNGGTYDATFLPITLSLSASSANRDLLLNYEMPLMANIHAGVSFVKSYYDAPITDTYFYGAPYNFGGVCSYITSAVSQTTNEFRLFVGGNPSAKTSIDLSVYFTDADYHIPNPNDPTSNTYVDARYNYAAPRLGFVWRPTASIAVRAATGGGFAEAPLNDLVASNESCLPSATTCNVGLNNLNLQPEKSFAFDLGTDIRIHHNTGVSFDVYRSDLYGQFYNSTTFIGVGTCPGNTTAPCYASQYGNLGVSRYEGVLLDLRHDASYGLYWVLSGGLTRGYLVSVPPGFYNTASGACVRSTGANCQNLTVVPNVNFNGTFTVSVPYSQALGTLGYRWNSDKYVDMVATYYGNNNTYFRPAFVEIDGHIGYPLTKNALLLLTFRNITGIYDNSTQVLSLAGFSGAPTISGLPYPLYGEEYGPRTAIMTLQVHM